MIKIKHIAMAFAVFALVTSCKKDEVGPTVSPYVGSYVISSASLTAPLTLTTNEIGDYTLQAGTDITEMIQSALLGSVACSSADKSRIELREDQSMFMSCDGEAAELNAGTWEETSATVLTLNMNNAAIPTSPTGVVLTVTDVVLAGNLLSGKTSIPLPRDMLAAITQAKSGGLATLNLDVTPEVVVMSITIEFTKK